MSGVEESIGLGAGGVATTAAEAAVQSAALETPIIGGGIPAEAAVQSASLGAPTIGTVTAPGAVSALLSSCKPIHYNVSVLPPVDVDLGIGTLRRRRNNRLNRRSRLTRLVSRRNRGKASQ